MFRNLTALTLVAVAGTATTASAAIVHLDVSGTVQNFYEESSDPGWTYPGWIPPGRLDLPKLTGVANGNAFSLRLTYDTDGEQYHSDSNSESVWLGAGKAVSAVLSVGSHIINIAGNATSDATIMRVIGGGDYASFISNDYNVIDPGTDPEDWDDLTEEHYAELSLHFIPDLFDTPLTLARNFVWAGSEYGGNYSYHLLDRPNEFGTSGFFDFTVTSVTSTVSGGPVPAPVPLPAGLPMLAGALVGLGVLRRRARA
ncbi:MAG: hypothetical protein Q4G49_10545 [Paracoccus sp. (in: a-proteobacteria)]|nr:hypothetical protein [Paracoccus sp. (in: a-proteobacteria)]